MRFQAPASYYYTCKRNLHSVLKEDYGIFTVPTLPLTSNLFDSFFGQVKSNMGGTYSDPDYYQWNFRVQDWSTFRFLVNESLGQTLLYSWPFLLTFIGINSINLKISLIISQNRQKTYMSCETPIFCICHILVLI